MHTTRKNNCGKQKQHKLKERIKWIWLWKAVYQLRTAFPQNECILHWFLYILKPKFFDSGPNLKTCMKEKWQGVARKLAIGKVCLYHLHTSKVSKLDIGDQSSSNYQIYFTISPCVLTVLRVCLQFVIVVFPDHTHYFLVCIEGIYRKKNQWGHKIRK